MPINLLRRLFEGDERSVKYKKNAILLILTQAANMLASLLLVPMVLDYLGVNEYGAWVTLTTIVAWFSFFDIGLGHGLRNKYAEAIAKNNVHDAKLYVSTAFFILLGTSILIYVAFSIGAQFIDWSMVLAAPEYLALQLKTLALVLTGTFCVRFTVNIVCILLIADQQPAVPAVLNLMGNVLSLAGVYSLTRFFNADMLYLGLCLSIAQVLPLFLAFIFLFCTRYKSIAPRYGNFSTSHVRSIFSLGIRFFFIQITALFLFQTNSLIIAHTCGLAQVTEYTIAYKYINILYVGFLTVLNPLWSASTEAYARKDFAWIKNCMTQLNHLWVLIMVVMGAAIVSLAPWVYQLWLKGSISPNLPLLVLMLVYFASLTRTSMYRYFMNGVGKIRLQFYITALQSLFHLPIAIILSVKFGVYGVLATMIFWNIINMIWEPLQFKKIVNKTAKGIWNQ